MALEWWQVEKQQNTVPFLISYHIWCSPSVNYWT